MATTASTTTKKGQGSVGGVVYEESSGLTYQTGFGNTFESECIEGALPRGRNNPRLVPYNLYTEQLSGTAFTAPRSSNRRVWLYRIQPSVVVGPSTTSTTAEAYFGGINPNTCEMHNNPLRWKPFPLPPPATEASSSLDFISGMKLMCASSGDVAQKTGIAIYMYRANVSMSASQKHFYNADGDFLIVPQQRALEIRTEVGRLRVAPTEIFVLPRGMVFQINVQDDDDEQDKATDETWARGYVLEVFRSASFQLPELGPIGSNGLANARDFCYPTAWCISNPETYRTPCTIQVKQDSRIFTKPSQHSPFNVVAWHGNYLPYKYDLKCFCAINSVTYDHLDPSIYTVLTCPSLETGTALADFVIFPPRIMATDSNTFRPPWFHRNTMSEFMGLIHGQYDAKEGFAPGGASLHNCMVPHGPDAATYAKAVADPCEQPVYFDGGLAFMFETCLPLHVAPEALQEDQNWLDVEYATCWKELKDQFTGWDALQKSAT